MADGIEGDVVPEPTAAGAAGRQPQPDLPLEVEDYLHSLLADAGRAPTTVRAYRRALRKYLNWLGAPAETAGPHQLSSYLTYLRDEVGAAASTQAQAYSAIAGLYRFLLDGGVIGVNPAATVAAPRAPAGLPKALEVDQVLALLGSPDPSTPVGLRDRALLEVLYGAGVRVSELVGLDVAAIDLDTRVLRVFGKGSKERFVPIGSHAAYALRQWFSGAGREAMIETGTARYKKRPDTAAAFVNQRGQRLSQRGAQLIVQRHGKRVGLKPAELTPHVLRHSCATHMLVGGADIRIVQELLGHASVATTQRYTRVTTEHLAEIYASAHPRARG